MRIKPLSGLTGPLRAVIVASIVVGLLALACAGYVYAQYSALPESTDVSAIFLASDAVSALAGLLQIIVTIASMVFFLMWVYRANKNLDALSGEPMTISPGWAVGWFFIPIANLWKPYQVVRELWQVSHRNEPRGHALVGWWWCAFLAAAVTGQVASTLSMNASDVGSYAFAAEASAISDALNVASDVLMLLVVARIAAAYGKSIVEPAVQRGGLHWAQATAPGAGYAVAPVAYGLSTGRAYRPGTYAPAPFAGDPGAGPEASACGGDTGRRGGFIRHRGAGRAGGSGRAGGRSGCLAPRSQGPPPVPLVGRHAVDGPCGRRRGAGARPRLTRRVLATCRPRTRAVLTGRTRPGTRPSSSAARAPGSPGSRRSRR